MSTINVVLIIFCTLFYVGIGSLTAFVFDTTEAIKKFYKQSHKAEYLSVPLKIRLVLIWPIFLLIYIFTKDVKCLEE